MRMVDVYCGGVAVTLELLDFVPGFIAVKWLPDELHQEQNGWLDDNEARCRERQRKGADEAFQACLRAGSVASWASECTPKWARWHAATRGAMTDAGNSVCYIRADLVDHVRELVG
jgi:hypothetical protein